MPKRIGILGGISHQSTLKYYELVHQKYYQIYKNHYYPEIVIFSLNFQEFTDNENSGNAEEYIAYIMSGIKMLENAGADFIIMAANSPHAFFDQISKKTKLPMISIAEATALKAKKENTKKLLLTGIKFTMQSAFYKDVCRKYGIEVITPSGKEQDEIDKIIFGELCNGVFKIETKQRLLNIIQKYQVDGVILGCTELPLILEQEDTKIRLLNTVDIHVDAALEYCLKDDR